MDTIYIVCFVLTLLLIIVTVMYFLKKSCETGNVCKPLNYVEPCSQGNVCKPLNYVTPYFKGPNIANFKMNISYATGYLSSDGLTIIWLAGNTLYDNSIFKRVTPVNDNDKTKLDTGSYMNNNTIVTPTTKPLYKDGFYNWVITKISNTSDNIGSSNVLFTETSTSGTYNFNDIYFIVKNS